MTSAGARLAQGAAAGLVATVMMSAWMAGLQRIGLLGRAPPRKITERVMTIVLHARPRRSRRMAASLGSHLLFGMGAGAMFQLADRYLPTRASRIVAGIAYGGAIWTAMYGYVLPKLDLMPRVARDRPGRPATMATAHLVFGAVLGATS